MLEIKSAAAPYHSCGLLEVAWVPLAGPEESDEQLPVREVDCDEVVFGICTFSFKCSALIIIIIIECTGFCGQTVDVPAGDQRCCEPARILRSGLCAVHISRRNVH